jgi:hypothetical protein
MEKTKEKSEQDLKELATEKDGEISKLQEQLAGKGQQIQQQEQLVEDRKKQVQELEEQLQTVKVG